MVTAILLATAALALPDNFDSEVNMIFSDRAQGRLHSTRGSAGFARNLVAQGSPTDLALAEKVLDAVLACQERRAGDPHRGNFWWYREDQIVEDLNAVQFVLAQLIPMMLEHGDRLSSEMQASVRQSIRLGLEEISRLDVLVAYSNITSLDILNSCLGGELLDDPTIAGRGYKKLVDWMTLTDAQGIPYEYNSPTYTAVTINALRQLARLVRNEETRIRARTMMARLGLSVALHIHPATGRWSGPHSRAYHPTVVAESSPEIERVRRWIDDGTMPGWIRDVLDQQPATMEVRETAHSERDLGITTYHSPVSSLGVATKEMLDQSNVLIAHYDRPGEKRPGVVFTRYLIDDKWLGSFYHATDRSTSRNLLEEGSFCGVQQGPRAIGLYTPKSLGRIKSAKACIIWTGRDQIDEMWIGSQRVTDLPADVPDHQVVVIVSGKALTAVLPLTRTRLGFRTPLRLVAKGDALVLELYNYLGKSKVFWEQQWPGPFFQGKPQCGFYLEMADRDRHPDGAAFGALVASGTIRDHTAPAVVYSGTEERPWTVEYSRCGKTLGIEVDLMSWKAKRRWTKQGCLGWPMLESPIARENRTGRVEVSEAVLTCGKAAGWLFASPQTGRWVAGFHGLQPAPLALTVPQGTVVVEAMGTGTVVWDNGRVTVEAVDLKGAPRVTGGRLTRGTR